jgi:TolA-binding protein
MKDIVDKYKNNEQLSDVEQQTLLQTILEVKGNRERRKHYQQLIDAQKQNHQTNVDAPNDDSKDEPQQRDWRIWLIIVAALLILVPFLILQNIPDKPQEIADRYILNVDNDASYLRGNDNNEASPDQYYKNGLYYLKEKKYEQAVAQLRKVESSIYWSDAKWYLAIAYVKQYDYEKACVILQMINTNEPKVMELMEVLKCL